MTENVYICLHTNQSRSYLNHLVFVFLLHIKPVLYFKLRTATLKNTVCSLREVAKFLAKNVTLPLRYTSFSKPSSLYRMKFI